MSTLWIREYKSIASQPRSAQIPQEPGTDQTPVSYSTAAQSAAFGATTRIARCISDAAFHYAVGSNPTATTSHLKWPADVALDIGVTPGQKLSVIAAA